MSRSYKYPSFKGKANKFIKRLSSKEIRRWLQTLEVGFKSSRQFKHQVNSYDICDWVFYPPEGERKEKAKRK